MTPEPSVRTSQQLYTTPAGAYPITVALHEVQVPLVGAQSWHSVHAGHADGALIIPTKGARVLLGRHWRLPARDSRWEFPRGSGEPLETPTQVAERELLEETGLRPASPPRYLGEIYPDTGLLTTKMHVFAVAVNDEPATSEEFSELTWHTADEVGSLVRTGELTCGLTLAAWALFRCA